MTHVQEQILEAAAEITEKQIEKAKKGSTPAYNALMSLVAKGSRGDKETVFAMMLVKTLEMMERQPEVLEAKVLEIEEPTE